MVASTTVSSRSLPWRADQLEEALSAGGSELDPDIVERAHATIERVRDRWALKGGRTVVSLAGATGSGKSSLFNALVGAEVATVAARRPTTSTANAAVWGEESSQDLLDWLDIPMRHQVQVDHESPSTPDPANAADDDDAAPIDLDGLVLIDLPDFDSYEEGHRVEADRILERSDVFVWVTDPQKYADARLHESYLSTLKDHDSVMIVVLNQVDRILVESREQIAVDLRSLVMADGAGDFEVITTSARVGAGVGDLRRRIGEVVVSRNAAERRLAGDIVATSRELLTGVANQEPQVSEKTFDQLTAALARSAGIPIVLNAVHKDYLRQSAHSAGWPFTRWVAGLRPDPLRRLHLGKGEERKKSAISSNDVRAVLGRSSLPPPTPVARSNAQMATRELASDAGTGLPRRWAEAVVGAATPDDSTLGDALDQAVINTPLRTKDPFWWGLWWFLQLCLAWAAVAGAVWLTALFGLSWAQIDIEAPDLGPISIPLLMVIGGLLFGLILAEVGRGIARAGAVRRRALIEERMLSAISAVAKEHVRTPVTTVLRRHQQTRQQLEAASTG